MVFHCFEGDSSLCVVAILNQYFERSEKWRTSDEWPLLLCFVQPHKPVVSSTISEWIKKVLAISGVNVGVFKGHSTRSALTSKAALSGLSVSDIFERGCCSNSSQ